MTMTDSGDPPSPRGPTSLDGSGKDELHRETARTGEGRGIRAPRGTALGAHFAPTDPEVPSAKRRGALRRQRSLFGLTAVIIGLLSITLALLYRASQRVGVREDSEGVPSLHKSRTNIVRSPRDAVDEGTFPGAAPPFTLQSGAERGDHAPATRDNTPAGSASSFPKGRPPAIDIIRTPTF
jgi:hypothetical protein